ncbi:MAG: LacI family DNA-binding transcriptional regulator [Rhizobiales bacterium]|nr:LacI family DNA-binding transcriptional regulator [Hyphomicrobiales bacterium]
MIKRNPRSTTLKDVARAAGVSYQTVSRAINGYPEISPATREKILRITKRLGYRPNRLAGSLRSKQSSVIGLVVSDIENVFFAEVVAGVESEARGRGYSVILANSSEDIVRERQAVISLFERRVDGLIIAPAEGDHEYLRSELPKKFPIVAFNRPLDGPSYGAVLTENERGAREAVEYLISHGHKKIGAIVASASLTTSRERLSGFRLAMTAAKLTIRPEWLATGSVRPEGAKVAAIKMFSMRNRPTALLTSSHRISEGVLLALKELGLRHGADVEIVSFDKVPWAALVEPPLTIVEQPTNHIGREAVRMLINMIDGNGGPSTIRLPARLISLRDKGFQSTT